jgi:predicted permease
MIPHEIKAALRVLGKNPQYAACAILSLALGTGANTAMFSLVNAVLVRPLPVKAPNELVTLMTQSPSAGRNSLYSLPFYRELNARTDAFSGVLARVRISTFLSTGDRNDRIVGELVSGNYFSVLGTRAILGRTITPEDDGGPGQSAVCTLSYGFWKRRFGSDPAVIGRNVLVNGRAYTVVGVTPASFYGVEQGLSPDIRIPLSMAGQVTRMRNWDSRGMRWLQLIARQKANSNPEHIRARTEALSNEILEAQGFPGVVRAVLAPARQGFASIRQAYQRPLMAMLAAVSLLMLLTCASVANLMLARISEKRQEIALRLALGADRGRLILQTLTESALLSLLGSAAGIIFARWIVEALVKLASGTLESATFEVGPDWHVFIYTAAAATITTLLIGAVPAAHSTRVLISSITGSGSADPRQPTLRKVLVGGQIAVSLVLLFNAVLFTRSLNNLESISPGFVADNLVVLTLNPTITGYKEEPARELLRRLREQLQSLPGVLSVSTASVSLLSGSMMARDVVVPGSHRTGDDQINHFWNRVGAGYFHTMGIPLVLGREFTGADRFGSRRVAIINQRMASYYWPGDNALGKHIVLDSDTEIVGVVGDTKYLSLRDDSPLIVYTAMLQGGFPDDITFHIRTSSNLTGAVGAIQSTVRSVDSGIGIYDVTTMSSQIERSLTTERLLTVMSAAFGLVALASSAIGLFGIMAYLTSRRAKEIGIRIALGASKRGIVGLVMRDWCRIVTGALVAGLSIAAACSRLLSSLLYGLRPLDPLALVIAISALLLIALAAALLPAWRAVHTEPALTLRYE